MPSCRGCAAFSTLQCTWAPVQHTEQHDRLYLTENRIGTLPLHSPVYCMQYCVHSPVSDALESRIEQRSVTAVSHSGCVWGLVTVVAGAVGSWLPEQGPPGRAVQGPPSSVAGLSIVQSEAAPATTLVIQHPAGTTQPLSKLPHSDASPDRSAGVCAVYCLSCSPVPLTLVP